MSKVLNFGSINIDETFEVPHLCQKGETLSSIGYTVRGGGKGKQIASNTVWQVFTPTTRSAFELMYCITVGSNQSAALGRVLSLRFVKYHHCPII